MIVSSLLKMLSFFKETVYKKYFPNKISLNRQMQTVMNSFKDLSRDNPKENFLADYFSVSSMK